MDELIIDNKMVTIQDIENNVKLIAQFINDSLLPVGTTLFMASDDVVFGFGEWVKDTNSYTLTDSQGVTTTLYMYHRTN